MSKIIIAAEIFAPDIGGPATYTERLALELVKLGHNVKVICYSTKSAKGGNYPFRLVRIERGQGDSASSPLLNTFFRYGRYLIELFRLAWSADVIYAQGPVCSGLPALLVAKFLNTKLVVKVVGDYAWEQAMNLGYTDKLIDEFQKEKIAGKFFWLKEIEGWVCKGADRIIVPSRYLKKIVSGWLASRSGGVAENKIEVIYNSFDLIKKYGAISKQDARNKFGFNNNDFVIISVGRSVAWKGFGLLAITIADLIQNNNLPIKLRILGVSNGEEVKRLVKLYDDKVVFEKHPIKGYNERDAIILRVADESPAGIQPKPKVYEYLMAADLFVLNTGYEGLSHSILEAFSFGVPVITTNVGGNPEVVKDNETGLLVEYNNKEQLKSAILRLYKDKELREKLVQNAKEQLSKFSFEEMIEKTLAIIGNSETRKDTNIYTKPHELE